MKKYLLSLFILGLVASPALAAAAESGDVWADEVYQHTQQVYRPENLLHAPDGAYTDFFAKNHTITLDLGENESGLGNLILHYELLRHGTSFWLEFLNENLEVLHAHGNTLLAGRNQYEIPYPQTQAYRYVRIRNTSDKILRLDAIEALDYERADKTVADEAAAEEGEMIPRGLLVKLVDDGDPLTSVDEAVYVIGGNGMRHAFPSEAVFYSWFENFDEVAFIDPENLAAYPLGKNVTVRPGTHLVKLTTDPKTYLVEPGGVLRWIASEDQARELYGENWAKRIIDVPDVFFGNYQIGQPLAAALHPTGTVGVLPSGEVVYVRNSVYYSLPGNMKQTVRLRSEFYAPIAANLAELYVHGGNFSKSMLRLYQYPY